MPLKARTPEGSVTPEIRPVCDRNRIGNRGGVVIVDCRDERAGGDGERNPAGHAPHLASDCPARSAREALM